MSNMANRLCNSGKSAKSLPYSAKGFSCPAKSLPYPAKGFSCPGKTSQSAKSLPIWSRMIQYYPFLRNVLYAQQFCVILLKQTVILGTTIEEREKILVVAMGGVWD